MEPVRSKVRMRNASLAPTPTSFSTNKGKTFPLSLPIRTVVLLASGIPLAWLLWQLVSRPWIITSAWPDRFRFELLCRTLAYNGVAALIAAALGLPVGIVLGRG